jgi:sulfur carrier protein ThiS
MREDRNESVAYEHDLTVGDILTKFGYNVETAVVTREGRVHTEDERIEDDDLISIIPVVSGG